jgi:CubicO group peptidase (beta-lactamase class C family)
MKNLGLIFFLVLFLLINSILSAQQETLSELGKRTEIIEREIPSLMKQYSIPGLSLAIIRNGQINYVKGFGVKNINTKEPVNNSTIFAAASLTKPVFSYLVLRLHDEGKIDIDTPLYKYIPDRYLEKYFIKGPVTEAGFDFEEFKKITGRLVLCHSTGLPVYQASRPLKFDFPPGEQFRYSPFSFRLLELAVYCIQGSDEKHFFKADLNVWMKKYVFEPLGMKRSSMIW